jgi:hypothetical protein
MPRAPPDASLFARVSIITTTASPSSHGSEFEAFPF